MWRAALSVLAIISASSANAASNATYKMVWNIDEQGSGVERSGIRPGGELLRLKLLPPGLFRTQSDIKNADGVVLISHGTQLVRMQSLASVACTFSTVKKSGADEVLFIGSLKRICIVDTDSDGKFDSSFLRATNGPAFFLLRGRLGDKMSPIVPVMLEVIDTNLIEGGPRVLLKFSGGSRPNRTTIVEGDVGNDSKPFSLPLIKVKIAELPAAFEAYGGTLQIRPAADETYAVTASGRFAASELDFWD